MSDKLPNEGDRNSNLSLFAADEKTRQQLTQAASSLFTPVPQMFPGALSPLTLHPSFAAVSQLAFQQIVNSAPRPPLFAGGSFFDVKPSAASFPGLSPFPTITSSAGAGPSVFSPPPMMKTPSAIGQPQQQQRAHTGPSPSPSLSNRQVTPAHSSSTPTVIVKQQPILGSGSNIGSSSQQSVRVGGGSGNSGHKHGHHHSSDNKSRVQPSDMPPVVIASPASGVRLVSSSPFQPMQPPSASGFPSSTPPGQPRLVPIQQQQQADVIKVSSAAGSSLTRPNVVQSSSSGMRHSSSQQQNAGAASGMIPVVKFSPAGNDQTLPVSAASKISRGDGRMSDSQQQSFHPTPNAGVFYASQSQVNAAPQMKTFPVQSSRVPWSPLVHPSYPHSRPVVPVGGNGQPVMTDADLSGGQHGVSSRPGILRKRPVGDGGNGSSSQSSNMATQSPRRSITRLPQPSTGGPSGTSSSSSIQPLPVSIYMPSSGQHAAVQNLTTTVAHSTGISSASAGGDQSSSGGHTFAPPPLNRDASTSSVSSQIGVKSETFDSGSEQPTRKKPRKQQFIPRPGSDNLMVTFDPLAAIPQLPTVPTSSGSSHHRQHKHAASMQNPGATSGNASTFGLSTANAVGGQMKEEADSSSTPEPELTEDDRKMAQLVAGEMSEFTDSDGVRWFSIRNGESSSKSSKHAARCQQSPAPKLSDFYRCTWRTRYNHFERHTDVRAKDERCPALSEFCLAARSHIPREAAGWRIVQFLTLMDDQMAVEHRTLDRITEVVESCRSSVDGGLLKHYFSQLNSNNNLSEGHHSTSAVTPANGGPARRGRGTGHRLSGGGSAARQAARTRQQHQQLTSSCDFPCMNGPFEYTQLPDMVNELNRQLKAVSNSVQSLYTVHVPVAHQLLDKYAPLKTLHARSSSSLSHLSSSSNRSTSASSTPVPGESVPLSPVLSNKDPKEPAESTIEHDQATEDCLMAAVESVSQQLAKEDEQKLAAAAETTLMETTTVSPVPKQQEEEQSVPKNESSLIVMESSSCVS